MTKIAQSIAKDSLSEDIQGGGQNSIQSDIKRYAIIVAGGSGIRMGASVPKQMLEIDGHPILRYTIERFRKLPFDVRIIVVMSRESKDLWLKYCKKEGLYFKYILADGGITRFHSVLNGLKYVKSADSENSIVAIHDAVRPFITEDELVRLYDVAAQKGSAIPYIVPVDSMRASLEEEYKYVDRAKYIFVQTPQVFKGDLLIDSYSQPFSTEFTDDASVVEKKGYPLTFCEGSRLNLKITTPSDLELANLIVQLRYYNL